MVVLEPYPIQPRRGWMAMNFFYNTAVDGRNLFVLDEPWSRPGDYVLLRALTDLVCVSSACPDDIDAANGWNPTDIHVRVYPETESFTRAVGHRKQPDPDVTMTRESGFHARTSAILPATSSSTTATGCPTATRASGRSPSTGPAASESVTIDLSPLRKFEVLGPGAEALLQHCLTRNVRRLAVGQVVYTAMCYDTGTMLDDGTLFRLGQRQLPLDLRLRPGRRVAARAGRGAGPRRLGALLHRPAPQPLGAGPAEPAGAGRGRVDAAGPAEHRGARLVPLHGGTAGRRGRSLCAGLAYRLHRRAGLRDLLPPRRLRTALWDAVWAAGEPHGLSPLGLEALDILQHRGGAGLPRLRVRRPDRPLRGRDRLHRTAQRPRRTTSAARPRCSGARPAPSAPSSAWSLRATRSRTTATASTSAATRWASSPRAPARR